jgi:hemoglobin
VIGRFVSNDFNEVNMTAKMIVCRLMPSLLIPLALVAGGCGNKQKQDRDFHTSGSREADQRAEQQVAKVQQLRGEGGKDAQENVKKSLFDRLGGEQGISAIVDDWISRAIADPRVNWERKGVKQGGISFSRGKSLEWNASPENVANMKKHIAQFITVATGGPAKYEGREMGEVHAGMRITNAEFDASVGDLKASLDKLGVATEVQKELLAIIESAREQVAKER